MAKTYVYKAYNNNDYIADFYNVTSEFTYSQDINSAGAELVIDIGASFDDVGATLNVINLVDEAGNLIVDELGNQIVTSSSYSFSSIPIDLANRVKVYAFDNYYPNGTLVFDGLITRFRTRYSEDTISLTVLSCGVQLDNYLISTSLVSFAVEQTVYETERTLSPNTVKPTTYGNAVAQSFNLASDTLIKSISVYMRSSNSSLAVDVAWYLYSGTPSSPGSLIESGGTSLTSSTAGAIELLFTSPKTLTAGDYFIKIRNSGGQTAGWGSVIVESTTTAPYGSGQLFTAPDWNTPVWTGQAEDLAFTVNVSDGVTGATFTSNDPGQIMRRVMDQFNGQGGILTYTNSTIDLTSSLGSYAYKIATVLEAIDIAYQLSPSGWYWYADVATNLLHFHNSSQTADHQLTLGKHFVDANIEYSLEEVANIIPYSGGDDGTGANVYKIYQSVSSISKYGQWLERLSDNRITTTTDLDTFGNNELGRRQNPPFQIEIEIQGLDYDIELFELGQMISFNGFNNLFDSLLFQIVRKTPKPDSIVLALGNVPPRMSLALDDARRRLTALETINNPNTPS